LSERSGQLSDRVLKAYRHKRKGAVAHNIDEISMLAQSKAFQIDHRARQATMRFHEPMAGLVANGCIHFLQLTAIDTHSIAMPLENAQSDSVKDLLFEEATETENEAARRELKGQRCVMAAVFGVNSFERSRI